MFSISNDELKKLSYAVDLLGDKDYFEIIHTHKDGTEEICKVKSGISEDGSKLWDIGAYTTIKGETYLAVVSGKVLKNIKLKSNESI